MSSYNGSSPRSLVMDQAGDLYNTDTQQMMVYIPADNTLEVFFKPKDGSTPLKPSFVSIPLNQ